MLLKINEMNTIKCFSCQDCSEIKPNVSECVGNLCLLTLTKMHGKNHVYRNCFLNKTEALRFINENDIELKLTDYQRPETRICYKNYCNNATVRQLYGHASFIISNKYLSFLTLIVLFIFRLSNKMILLYISFISFLRQNNCLLLIIFHTHIFISMHSIIHTFRSIRLQIY